MRQSVASSNVSVWELPYPGYLTYLCGKFQIQYVVRVLLDGYSTSTVHDLLTAQLLKTPVHQIHWVFNQWHAVSLHPPPSHPHPRQESCEVSNSSTLHMGKLRHGEVTLLTDTLLQVLFEQGDLKLCYPRVCSQKNNHHDVICPLVRRSSVKMNPLITHRIRFNG